MSSDRHPEARSNAEGDPRPAARTAAEWTLFVVCFLLVVALVGLIMVDWVTGPSGPPMFEVRVLEQRAADSGVQVRAEVKNIGNSSAAMVRVAAAPRSDGPLAEQTVDFMAPGETATVTFVFTEPPPRSRLRVRVVSFQEP